MRSSHPTVLDIPPHNVHSLVCTVSLPITITVNFEWRRSIAGSESLLTSNGGDVIITDSVLDDFTSESILEISELTAGSVVYTCVISIPAASIQLSLQATVNVRGTTKFALHWQ